MTRTVFTSSVGRIAGLPGNVADDPSKSDDPKVINKTSANWGGLVDYEKSGYDWAYGRLTIPTTDGSACTGGPDSFLMWAGIGGWNQHGLVQNGVAVLSAGDSKPFAWWEVILPGGPDVKQLPMQPISMAISPGDDVSFTTHYITSPSHYVRFTWHNISTGTTVDQVAYGNLDPKPDVPSDWGLNQVKPTSGTGGYHISDFYFGGTAEIIDERADDLSAHQYNLLRKHADANWHDTTTGTSGSTNPVGVRSQDRYHVRMISNNDTSKTLEGIGGGAGTTGSFTGSWQNRCGTLQSDGG